MWIGFQCRNLLPLLPKLWVPFLILIFNSNVFFFHLIFIFFTVVYLVFFLFYLFDWRPTWVYDYDFHITLCCTWFSFLCIVLLWVEWIVFDCAILLCVFAFAVVGFLIVENLLSWPKVPRLLNPYRVMFFDRIFHFWILMGCSLKLTLLKTHSNSINTFNYKLNSVWKNCWYVYSITKLLQKWNQNKTCTLITSKLKPSSKTCTLNYVHSN